MQIAILLYDRFTVLDAIGPYQVLSGLPGAQVAFVAERPGPIRDEVGSLILSAEAGLPDVPHPDIIVVPGGPGQNSQMQDGLVHEWLRAADRASTWTTSVCTGSLILAAAGLLTGRRATSHWLALDELGRLGATPVSERVVFDGKYVTAAGVSSGIDMGLALAGQISRRRCGPGHPAHDRVRPPAALRRRLSGPRSGRDRPQPARPQPLHPHRLTGPDPPVWNKIDANPKHGEPSENLGLGEHAVAPVVVVAVDLASVQVGPFGPAHHV